MNAISPYFQNNDNSELADIELDKFYNKVKQFPINKIICLDETSVGSALKPTYSRCNLGRRCIIKTTSQFVFRKFTLLVAISNSK